MKVVCPKCSYGFDSIDTAHYECPNPDCGHRWQSLTATMGIGFTIDGREAHPELVFRAGERVGLVHTLDHGETILGRADDCTIRVTNLEVSRQHVRFQRVGDECLLIDMDSRRGVFLNGKRVKSSPLKMGDELLIAGILIEYRVRYEARSEADAFEQESSDTAQSADEPKTRSLFAVRHQNAETERVPLDKDQVTVGRHPDRDLCIEHPLVSRRHAVLSRERGANGETTWSVLDVKSRNGTFVNGRPIIQTVLRRGDRLQFGPGRFVFDGISLVRDREDTRAALDARGLTVRRGGTTILKDVDLRTQASELIGIIGPSGSGKTTLLNALSGCGPVSGGAIHFNDVDVRGDDSSMRSDMGYVPQDDIIHTELTPYRALRYAGRLRLPRDTSSEELDRLVHETLQTLGLEERANLRISKLSGGQRKRVSLGVELLTRARLLFMDEPTSGLDPGTEARMMQLFRLLADQGRTIVLTTHVMENVDALDKVAVLAEGRLVFFGTPKEMMSYFGISRATYLYDRLEQRSGDEWAALFARSRERERHLAEESELTERSAAQARANARSRRRRVHPWTQLRVLSQRYAHTLSADWRNVLLMVLQPLIIFPAICGVFQHAGTILFLSALAMFWLGCTNAVRELVKERPIFLREHMVGVEVPPYVLSKLVVLTVVSLAQALFAVVFVRYVEGVPGDTGFYVLDFLTATLAGLTLGLFVSAIASTSEQATSVLPMILIPQIVFGGFILDIDQMNAASRWASHLFSTRWSYEALKYTFQERYYDIVWRDIWISLGFAAFFAVAAVVWLSLRDRSR